MGRWQEYCPLALQEAIENCALKTREYNEFHLTILIAYSGIDEMVETIKTVAARAGTLPERIDENWIKESLWTRELPPVDLVIRTGGEPHFSEGVMMWDIANAQLYFTETLWPAFSPEEFRAAIEQYTKRERRFGA